MPKPKRYFHVITADGQDKCGSEILDNALRTEADKINGLIVDHDGWVVYISPVLAESAESHVAGAGATAPEAPSTNEEASDGIAS